MGLDGAASPQCATGSRFSPPAMGRSWQTTLQGARIARVPLRSHVEIAFLTGDRPLNPNRRAAPTGGRLW